MSEKQNPNAMIRHLPKGEMLFREGDASDRMYIIQEGKVSICRMRGLQMIELTQLGAGQVLGELSFFDRKERSATAVALTDVTIMEIPFYGLDKIWDGVPDYLKAIIVAVADRLRNANDMIRLLKKDAELPPEGTVGASDDPETKSKK